MLGVHLFLNNTKTSKLPLLTPQGGSCHIYKVYTPRPGKSFSLILQCILTRFISAALRFDCCCDICRTELFFQYKLHFFSRMIQLHSLEQILKLQGNRMETIIQQSWGIYCTFAILHYVLLCNLRSCYQWRCKSLWQPWKKSSVAKHKVVSHFQLRCTSLGTSNHKVGSHIWLLLPAVDRSNHGTAGEKWTSHPQDECPHTIEE